MKYGYERMDVFEKREPVKAGFDSNLYYEGVFIEHLQMMGILSHNYLKIKKMIYTDIKKEG